MLVTDIMLIHLVLCLELSLLQHHPDNITIFVYDRVCSLTLYMNNHRELTCNCSSYHEL